MPKSHLFFLVLCLLLICSCNLPIQSLVASPGPTEIVATRTYESSVEPLHNVQTPDKPPTIMYQTPTTQLLGTTNPSPLPTFTAEYDSSKHVLYQVQSGDTLRVVAAHFGVNPDEIMSSQPLPPHGLLPNHQTLIIPRLVEQSLAPRFLLPDSEVVNSPCGRNFNVQKYVDESNGKLRTYSQEVNSRLLSGAEIVRLVSDNTSINPRFLLAFIELRSQWVLSNPLTTNLAHPLGLDIPNIEGLYNELTSYSQLVNIGYYAWRQGEMTELAFLDGDTGRIAPDLNAGSVALQYLFARMFKKTSWEDKLYGPNGFISIYEKMFGDPIECSRTIEPLFPDGLKIPTLELPFAPDEAWALTGGLHQDWNTGTPLGALDFAPITGELPCAISQSWVLASAPGIITRSEDGALRLSLVDERGNSTGWEILYMHIADKDRISAGAHVATNDPIGHPSCEGGVASGTHVHMARIYRGEWIGAGDPFPFILSGWLALPGTQPYQSTMIKGEQVVISRPDGSNGSVIIRK